MTNTVAEPEQTFVQNEFGTVTNKRVVYYRSKGWFSGGSREDIPLQHITSVRLETCRNIIGGLLLLLVGLALIAAPDAFKIIGALFLIFAILLLWGSPAVVVNTAGRDLNAAQGLPWSRSNASAFVEALRKQLFDNKQSGPSP
jgi:hypothetical protein